jgi:hypothetical protein
VQIQPHLRRSLAKKSWVSNRVEQMVAVCTHTAPCTDTGCPCPSAANRPTTDQLGTHCVHSCAAATDRPCISSSSTLSCERELPVLEYWIYLVSSELAWKRCRFLTHAASASVLITCLSGSQMTRSASVAFWFAKWNLAVTNDLDTKFASAKSEDGVCNGQLVCGDLREPIPSYRTYSSSAESDGLSSV